MADKSLIEWTDATWPIVQGCDPVSPGCENCYAIKVVHRLAWSPNKAVSGPLKGVVEYHETAKGNGKLRFTGKVALREDRMAWPLKWKKPRKIFVPSHGDIFHKDVPDEFIDKIFAVMALCPQHTFQVLTKRAERMRAYMSMRHVQIRWLSAAKAMTLPPGIKFQIEEPLPNVWLGVSAERQEEADERIPHLLATPAVIRFVSYEPALGPINFKRIKVGAGWQDVLSGWRDCADYLGREETLDWIITGGESGPNARPAHPDWFRSIRDQCVAAGVAYFHKQNGEWVSVSEVEGPGDHFSFPNGATVRRTGKKLAGRTVDGRQHNDFPNQGEHHA